MFPSKQWSFQVHTHVSKLTITFKQHDFREQAAQWWEKREAEWERERNSRKKLLQSVLSERQNQLTERLEKVKRNKEKILEDREEMLLDIESKKNQIAKEIETQREKRQNLITGLNRQIEEKNEQIIAEIEYDNKGKFLKIPGRRPRSPYTGV